jgi:hypothetical protein
MVSLLVRCPERRVLFLRALDRGALIEAADIGRELRPLRNELEHHAPA